MAEQKRVRRTPEQIAADIDGQISKLEENIRGLEEKKIAACAEFDAKIAAVQEKAAKLAERKKEVLSPKKRKPRKSKAERIGATSFGSANNLLGSFGSLEGWFP